MKPSTSAAHRRAVGWRALAAAAALTAVVPARAADGGADRPTLHHTAAECGSCHRVPARLSARRLVAAADVQPAEALRQRCVASMPRRSPRLQAWLAANAGTSRRYAATRPAARRLHHLRRLVRPRASRNPAATFALPACGAVPPSIELRQPATPKPIKEISMNTASAFPAEAAVRPPRCILVWDARSGCSTGSPCSASPAPEELLRASACGWGVDRSATMLAGLVFRFCGASSGTRRLLSPTSCVAPAQSSAVAALLRGRPDTTSGTTRRCAGDRRPARVVGLTGWAVQRPRRRLDGGTARRRRERDARRGGAARHRRRRLQPLATARTWSRRWSAAASREPPGAAGAAPDAVWRSSRWSRWRPFWWLQWRSAPPPAVAATTPPRPRTDTTTTDRRRIGAVRILLVEDDPLLGDGLHAPGRLHSRICRLGARRRGRRARAAGRAFAAAVFSTSARCARDGLEVLASVHPRRREDAPVLVLSPRATPSTTVHPRPGRQRRRLCRRAGRPERTRGGWWQCAHGGAAARCSARPA